MTAEERRRRSAELMAEECVKRGLPLVASDEQHHQVAAILAGAGNERVVARRGALFGNH
jgi:hypothetical protein